MRVVIASIPAPNGPRAAVMVVMPLSTTSLALCPRVDDLPLEAALRRAVAQRSIDRLQAEYFRQGELLVLDRFLSPAAIQTLRADVDAVQPFVHRGEVPWFKRAGAVSAPLISRHAPALFDLYRSPTLRAFLSRLVDLPLLLCPPDDPHACALYQYDRPGDRIGFHYDTSFYRGARFTVLVGLVDDSSARLVCRLHTRDRGRPQQELQVPTRPGTLVVFHGDKLQHAVSPIAQGERRVVLSLQYLTRTDMSVCGRAVSDLKDACAYFGAAWWLRARTGRRPRALP